MLFLRQGGKAMAQSQDGLKASAQIQLISFTHIPVVRASLMDKLSIKGRKLLSGRTSDRRTL